MTPKVISLRLQQLRKTGFLDNPDAKTALLSVIRHMVAASNPSHGEMPGWALGLGMDQTQPMDNMTAKVPSQPVVGDQPHNYGPRTPGVPEGTASEHPENRPNAVNREGFSGDKGVAEPEKGKLTALASKSLNNPLKAAEVQAIRKEEDLPIDRNVPGVRDSGAGPNRSYKPAPRRSNYLPH